MITYDEQKLQDLRHEVDDLRDLHRGVSDRWRTTREEMQRAQGELHRQEVELRGRTGLVPDPDGRPGKADMIRIPLGPDPK